MKLILATVVAIASFLAGMYFVFVSEDYSKALVFLCCCAVFSTYIMRQRRKANSC